MEYAELADTGLSLSRIGFGCWTISGHGWGPVDDADSIAAIHRALDLGVTFFDTADVYGLGHSEEILAAGLGERRKDVVIATKFGLNWDSQGTISRDISPTRVVEALEGSLRRLRLDCLPLFQIHWPDGETPIGETVDALQRCQQAGKVRHIGCCNFPLELIQEARRSGNIVSIQAAYNLLEKEIEASLLPYCEESGMAVLPYSPLAQGLLSGKYGTDSRFGDDDIRSRSRYFQPDRSGATRQVVQRLAQIAERHGKTPAQVALRWVLDRAGVTSAITGIRTVSQIEENVGATDWRLSPEDRESLTAAWSPGVERSVPLTRAWS